MPDYHFNGSIFTAYFVLGRYVNGYITTLRENTYIEKTYRSGDAGHLFRNYYDGKAGYSALDIGIAAKIYVYSGP